jgi:hypothetical protein
VERTRDSNPRPPPWQGDTPHPAVSRSVPRRPSALVSTSQQEGSGRLGTGQDGPTVTQSVTSLCLAPPSRSLRPCAPTNSSAGCGSVWTPSDRPPRAELLHVLMLPDLERADRIGEFWGYPESRAFAELPIECEEDRTLRAVLVGMLRPSVQAPVSSSGPTRSGPGAQGPWSARPETCRLLGSPRRAPPWPCSRNCPAALPGPCSKD